MNALIFVGSGRLDSHTRALGEAIEGSLQSHGATTTLFELAKIGLPMVNPAFHRDPSQNPDLNVRQLVKLATEAELFVFLSPIYHNSYSGILKNALDHLAIAQFADKVVGLGSHGGNRATQAVDQLRIVARGLNAIAIPTQVCTQDSDFISNDTALVLNDENIKKRVERFTTELVKVGSALRKDINL